MSTYHFLISVVVALCALLPLATKWAPTAALARLVLGGARFTVKAAFAIAATTGFILALIQMGIIVTRNVFEISFIKLEEIPFYLFGVMFLLAGGAILLMDGHVRVDVFYSKWSARVQKLVDIVGLYLFTMPLGVLVMVAAGPFVGRAVTDGALNPGGIPAVFYLKTLIPIFGLMVLLAGAVRAGELLASSSEEETTS